MRDPMRIVKLFLVSLVLAPTLLQSADVDVEKLSAYISRARDDWEVPGLAVAIV